MYKYVNQTSEILVVSGPDGRDVTFAPGEYSFDSWYKRFSDGKGPLTSVIVSGSSPPAATKPDFIFVSVAIVDSGGEPLDPTSVTATFYRPNTVSGNLQLASEIELGGVIPLSKQESKTGFWGESVDVRGASSGTYTILYEIQAPVHRTIGVENRTL